MHTLRDITACLKETAGQWQEGLGRWSGDAEQQRRGLRLQVLARADRHLAAVQQQPVLRQPRRRLAVVGAPGL